MTILLGRCALSISLVAVLLCSAPARAGNEDGNVLILAPPLARGDAIWMAQSKGFFKAEELTVSVRWMAGGSDALGVFARGRDGTRGFGDFIVVNEVAAVNFWQSSPDFVVIAALARDAQGYVGVARTEIANPQALKTRVVATRLGSTSAWLLGEYLRAHGLSERDVALKNESPEAIMSWDLDASDVAAFFVREPFGSRALAKHGDRVRRLTTASGYGHGYLLVGTWKQYLHEHPGVAERLLRALDRGRAYAADQKDEVIDFARGMFGGDDMGPVEADYASTDRVVGLDRTTLADFRKLGRWMLEAGLLNAPFDPSALFEPAPLRASCRIAWPPSFADGGLARCPSRHRPRGPALHRGMLHHDLLCGQPRRIRDAATATARPAAGPDRR
jgi:NitT/TauT family transport system substrate-binding protein